MRKRTLAARVCVSIAGCQAPAPTDNAREFTFPGTPDKVTSQTRDGVCVGIATYPGGAVLPPARAARGICSSQSMRSAAA